MNEKVSDTASAPLAPLAPLDQLYALVRATGQVLIRLELVDSCRFGPAEVVDAAVADLHESLRAIDELGPKAGLPPLRALHDPTAVGPDADLANQLAASVRRNLDRIREGSAALSLELRRLVADVRDAVSVATGSAGTYDSQGRTTTGQLRRTRGQV